VKIGKLFFRLGVARFLTLWAVMAAATLGVLAGTLSPSLESALPQLPDSADVGMVIVRSEPQTV